MFVNEALDDVLKGKSRDQINIDLMKKYGVPYSDLNETLESLKALGVQAKISRETVNEKIQITTWDILRSQNETQWNSVGTAPTLKMAEEIVQVLKKRLNIHESNDYVYKIEPNNWHNYLSNIEAIKLLSKLNKLTNEILPLG